MTRATLLALTLAAAVTTAAAAQDSRVLLSRDSTAWLDVGGSLRVRGEGWSGFTAPAPEQDAFALSRLMYHADLHLSRYATVFAELKSSLATNRSLPGGVRPSDEDRLDIQQLYAEGRLPLASATLAVRAGRTDLKLGRERLVSPLDWSNSRRTFQGVTTTLTSAAITAQAFWTRPVTTRSLEPNVADSTRQIYGVSLSHKWSLGRALTDVYWLRNELRSGAFNGTTGYERRHTFGQRTALLTPRGGGPDAELETALQTGNVGAGRVHSFMLAAQAGWTFGAARPARVYLGFDAAGGDDSTGGAVGTFNQLYPLGHAYFGYMDFQGRQNVLDLSAGGTARGPGALAMQLDVHHFRRASTADAWYGVDGAVLRAAGTSTERELGTELDVTLKYPLPRQHLALQGGYGRYWRGAFIRATTGTGRAVDWLYLQAVLTL